MTGQLPRDAIQTILSTEDRILAAFAMTAPPVNIAALLAILPMTRANAVFTSLPPAALAAALGYSSTVAPGTVEYVAKQLAEWGRREADTHKAPPAVAPPAAVSLAVTTVKSKVLTAAPFVLAASISWSIYLLYSLKPDWLAAINKTSIQHSATKSPADSDMAAKASEPIPASSKPDANNLLFMAPNPPPEAPAFNDVIAANIQIHEPQLAALEPLKASPAPGINVAAMSLSSKTTVATGARNTSGTVVVPDQSGPAGPVLFTGANYSIEPQHGLRLGFHLRNNQAKPAQGKVYASARYLHRSGQIELIDGRPYPFPFTVKHIAPAAISFLPTVTDGAFVDLLIDVRNLNGESLTHREIEVTGP